MTDTLVHSARDAVNHPSHYNEHESGVEAIDICEHLGFNLGNAMKYIWRAGRKSTSHPLEDAQKALWYVRRARMNYISPRPDQSVHAVMRRVIAAEPNERIAHAMRAIFVAACGAPADTHLYTAESAIKHIIWQDHGVSP